MNRLQTTPAGQDRRYSMAAGVTGLSEVSSPAEWLSALVDGECAAEEWGALDAEPAQLRGRWSDFHLVGEVLRSGSNAAHPCDPGAVEAIMARVALEKPDWQLPQAAAASVAPQVFAPATAANDSVFRWKMVAGLASVAAVVALAWPLTVATTDGAGAQLAASSGAPAASQVALPRDTLVSTGSGVLVRDPELEALIAAHRQAGGMSALQMPAGFLRNATFEAPQR